MDNSIYVKFFNLFISRNFEKKKLSQKNRIRDMYSMGYNRRDLGPWETQYCAYSTVFLGKDNLDEGDKIILPESALVALGKNIHSFVYTIVAFLLTLCLSHTHPHTHSHTYIQSRSYFLKNIFFLSISHILFIARAS